MIYSGSTGFTLNHNLSLLKMERVHSHVGASAIFLSFTKFLIKPI